MAARQEATQELLEVGAALQQGSWTCQEALRSSSAAAALQPALRFFTTQYTSLHITTLPVSKLHVIALHHTTLQQRCIPSEV